jgi:pimeloyl-ACP methyl ester carboxylesterase
MGGISMRQFCLAMVACCLIVSPVYAGTVPDAVIADPPADARFPARMEVIHIPSGGVEINGVVYVASGPGVHPTFVFFHGLPGNEKNLDLAQAVRRAGWNAVTLNYRGSWGSPGHFSFAQNLEDARAALAFIRDPENAKRLNIDAKNIAIGGHSMGGWVAAETAASDHAILGAVMISAGDFGTIGQLAQNDRAAIVKNMAENKESLAGVTPESMADELTAHSAEWSFKALAPALVGTKLYVLYSKDFVQSDSETLINAIKSNGGKLMKTKFIPTDHSWSDKRITLESLVITWLQELPKSH